MAEKKEQVLEKIEVTLTSDEGNVFSGEVHSIFVPGKSGALEITPGHTKIVSLLRKGAVILKEKGQNDRSYEIEGGFLQVNRDCVEILIVREEKKNEQEVGA